jgi:hypothetical protein
MNQYELFTLNEYLAAYPKNMTYEEIINAIELGNPDKLYIDEHFMYEDYISNAPVAFSRLMRLFKTKLEILFIPRN